MARGRRSGRAIATVGLTTGATFLVGQLLAGDRALGALMKASLAALAVMAVGGVAEAFWRGDRLEEAEAGGLRVRFGRAGRAVSELDRRLAAYVEDVNRRVYTLEQAVFGEEDGSGASDDRAD
jgi:hypothetical protein